MGGKPMSDPAKGAPQSEVVEALSEIDEIRSGLEGRKPDIDSIHRDLATANAYRQEFIKSLILISGALFAFSVSFRPELRTVSNEELFWVAWIALGVSMIGGFAQLAA